MIRVWFRWSNYVAGVFKLVGNTDGVELNWTHIEVRKETAILLKIIADGESYATQGIELW